MDENKSADKADHKSTKQDLPDAPALNDSYTRDFLQSTNETEEGFYPFVSKTKRYKMDFPAGGVIDDRSYMSKGHDHEEFSISIEDDTGFGMSVIYYSNHTKERLEDDLDRFKKRMDYDGDFKTIKQKDQTLYYAHIKDDVFRTFMGYVLNEKGSGAIELDYNIDCQDEREEICKENKQSDKERGMHWLKSVQFINENGTDKT